MKGFLTALLTALTLSFGAQAAAIDTTNTPQAFAQTTACNAASAGSRATINDGPNAPGWDSIVAAGGGSSTVAVFCDGTAWKVYAGGGSSAPTPPPVTTMAAPVTNQGNYGTGCNGGSCITFDENWSGTALNTSAWFAGLVINNQYLNGGIGLVWPYSGWTVCNCNGGTTTAFLDYSYGYGQNPVNANFLPLRKASDGSLQLTFGLNSALASKGVQYIGAAISSAYTPNTMITHAGGMMQWRGKMDKGVQYGAYPGMQCSAAGQLNGASGTTYNANTEFGYTWIGTPLTDVAFGVNNVTASSANGNGTSANGVYQHPTTNDLTNWHTYGIEYTGDGTRKWNYYVDGVLRDTANATQPAGTDFNCSWQIFNSVSANAGWHSSTDANNPGPFSMWISNIQFYRRPGT